MDSTVSTCSLELKVDSERCSLSLSKMVGTASYFSIKFLPRNVKQSLEKCN